MRPGIFEDAIAKINSLQPAFVITTGDLIGYSAIPLNPKSGTPRGGREFEDIVAKLEMPFYYVPGNHDIKQSLAA